ncbi:hypothetical protein DNTS_012280 [Danionella cerebrum]|uniref:Immunoglobulin domain-containing protein n=1 Tax=Danionella cerebrum TaxID=2873325 RepID=A0A553PEF7_9TELE|nr:hypothetical protein DNTS_012280 [Danionella translucida]
MSGESVGVERSPCEKQGLGFGSRSVEYRAACFFLCQKSTSSQNKRMIDILIVMIFGLSGRVMTKDRGEEAGARAMRPVVSSLYWFKRLFSMAVGQQNITTDTKGKFSSPVLDVTEKELVLERNQTLQLNCRGRWETQWVLPSGVPKFYEGTHIENTKCGKKKNQHCSRLVLSPALSQHTGSYRCRYRQKERKQISVYVYITAYPPPLSAIVPPSRCPVDYGLTGTRTSYPVRLRGRVSLETRIEDAMSPCGCLLGCVSLHGSGHLEGIPGQKRNKQRPFIKVQSTIPDVVYMKEGEPLVFPCRVTNPDAKVSLVKIIATKYSYTKEDQFPLQQLVPDHRNIIWNSRQGFIIRSPTYFYIGLFSCETTVNGVKYSNNFLTHRPGMLWFLSRTSWRETQKLDPEFDDVFAVNKILEVYLNSTGLVRTLQGEMLALNCTVTAEWNSRVSISWSYPQKVKTHFAGLGFPTLDQAHPAMPSSISDTPLIHWSRPHSHDTPCCRRLVLIDSSNEAATALSAGDPSTRRGAAGLTLRWRRPRESRPEGGWMGLSSAMGTAALLSQPGRRRRRASCAKNQSAFPLVVWLPPRRETASQQRDCPSVFKRGTELDLFLRVPDPTHTPSLHPASANPAQTPSPVLPDSQITLERTSSALPPPDVTTSMPPCQDPRPLDSFQTRERQFFFLFLSTAPISVVPGAALLAVFSSGTIKDTSPGPESLLCRSSAEPQLND